MNKTIRYFSVCTLFFLLINSCCGDDMSIWFPSEAVRYYNDHDSIAFYCPENDSFVVFQVCSRSTNHLTETAEDRCGIITRVYFMDYFLYSDSCHGENLLRVSVFPEVNNNNNVTIDVSILDYSDLISTSYTESPKSTVEILGHTYENTIQIFSTTSWADLEFIIFSYEYGIIQIKYESQTFNLMNNETI